MGQRLAGSLVLASLWKADEWAPNERQANDRRQEGPMSGFALQSAQALKVVRLRAWNLATMP